MPQTRSERTGLCLWGIAEEPFCRCAKGSSSSADLGLLEQPDGGGEALQAGTQDGDRGDEGGVTVPRQHLGGGGGDAEPETAADVLLDLGRDRRVGSHRSAHLADRDLRRGGGQAGAAAPHLVEWLASLTPRLSGSA